MAKLKKSFYALLLLVLGVLGAGLISSEKASVLDGRVHAAQSEPDWKNLNMDQAFKLLSDSKYLENRNSRMRGVLLKAFQHRIDAATEYSITQLSKPMNTNRGGSEVPEYRFDIAREILLTFKDKALTRMIRESKNSKAVVRGNVLQVISKVARDQNDKAIKAVLVEALEDQNFCEEDYTLAEDDAIVRDDIPLRVCDVAYNELVLRYGVKGIPRVIGSIVRLEERDYQIEALKVLMQ